MIRFTEIQGRSLDCETDCCTCRQASLISIGKMHNLNLVWLDSNRFDGQIKQDFFESLKFITVCFIVPDKQMNQYRDVTQNLLISKLSNREIYTVMV